MAEDISKKIIAALLLVTIVLSATSLWFVMDNGSQVIDGTPSASGKVNIYINGNGYTQEPQITQEEGNVGINIVPSQ